MSEAFYLSANISTSTDSWGTVIERLNQLIYDEGTINVTTAANSIGGFTSGNAYVQGIFSSNTIAVAQTLRGGNVNTTNTLYVVSNTDFANSTLVTVGANLYSTNTAFFTGSLLSVTSANITFAGTNTTISGTNLSINANTTWNAGANIAFSNAAFVKFADMAVNTETTLLKVKADGTGLEYSTLTTANLTDVASTPPAGGQFLVWDAGDSEYKPTSTITAITVTDSINVANTLSSNVAGQFVDLDSANATWAAGWTGSDSTDNWGLISAANSTVSYTKLRAQTIEFNTFGTGGGVVSINKTGTGNEANSSFDLHANGSIKTDGSLEAATVLAGNLTITGNASITGTITGTFSGTSNNATYLDGQPASAYLRSNADDETTGQFTVSNRLIVSGNTIQLSNDKAISAANTTGGQVDLIKRDSSNRTLVGTTGTSLRVQGSGANFEFTNTTSTYVVYHTGNFDPTTKADSSHTHAISAITGLQTELNNIANSVTDQTVSGLSDTTISSVANGEILVFQNGIWINQTLAEADIANTSHTQAISTITGLQANLDSKFDASKRIVVTANHNAQAEQRIGADTSLGPITITAPLSPANNTHFEVQDIGGYAGSNNITIDFGAQTFYGASSDDLIIDQDNIGTGLLFANNTWRLFR